MRLSIRVQNSQKAIGKLRHDKGELLPPPIKLYLLYRRYVDFAACLVSAFNNDVRGNEQ